MLLRHDAPEPAVCSQRLPPDWPVPGSALLRHAWDHPPMHQVEAFQPPRRAQKRSRCCEVHVAAFSHGKGATVDCRAMHC